MQRDQSYRLFSLVKHKTDFLLYRGSRDGFTPLAFHSRCDGKSNTVTIIKSSLNKTFGGYTSKPWKSDFSYSYDSDAFLFSLDQYYDLKSKFKVADPSTAIWNNPRTGPVFGSFLNYNFCDILVGFGIEYSNYADFGSSYTLPKYLTSEDRNKITSFLAGSFFSWGVAEIEVYQVTF